MSNTGYSFLNFKSLSTQSQGFYLFFIGYLLFALGVFYMAEAEAVTSLYRNLAIGGLILVALLYLEQGLHDRKLPLMVLGSVFLIYSITYGLFLFKASQTEIIKLLSIL